MCGVLHCISGGHSTPQFGDLVIYSVELCCVKSVEIRRNIHVVEECKMDQFFLLSPQTHTFRNGHDL